MTKKKPPSRRHRASGASTFAIVLGLVAVPLLVWVLARAGNEEPGRVHPAEGPGVAHVHGLGVNPSDGSLYVATHTGTFRIPEEGQAERIGASYQDTMGFTVAGPDRFLGSGHPDVPGRGRDSLRCWDSSRAPTPARPGRRFPCRVTPTSTALPSPMSGSTDGTRPAAASWCRTI
jgi:hypothetical protein